MFQLPLLVPQSDWRPLRVADLPGWTGVKRIAIDIETCDPTLKQLGPGVRRGAYIVGYSYAIEDGPKHYVPLRHKGGDNVEDADQALGWFTEQAKNFEGEIVGANLSYDCDFLWAAGVKFPKLKMYRDIQIAEPLIDDLAMSYSLEKIANKYLGIGKDESLLREAANAYSIDPKKDLHLLPARYVGAYAEADSALPLLILRRQEREIEEQELWNIYNLESKVLPVLVRMRQRGVRVDLKKLEEIERWSIEEEKKALLKIKQLSGIEVEFNSVWKAEALAKALQSIGIKVPLTPKTKKPSIDKAFLNSINHPVADAIKRARNVNKIRTTFAASIREYAIGDRIHGEFHQLRSSTEEDDEQGTGGGRGARFGRCSSSNPNLQQQPARDPEIGPFWRSIYIPEEGELWCSADYSSQEPKQTIHYATSIKLGRVKVRTLNGNLWVDADKSAFEMAEKYRNDRSTDLHQELANIIMGRIATKEERGNIKIIFLGLSYGMGGSKLCHSLGLPTILSVRDPESGNVVEASTELGRIYAGKGGRIYEAAGAAGQELLDKFDAMVPFVRALSKVCTAAANAYHYIRTEQGRKCRFFIDKEGNVEDAHKSMNKLIQGSAADQTKKALVDLDAEGLPIALQIHDEICASVPDRKMGELIAEIMEKAYILKVPNRVDLELGSSWGDAH